MFDPVDVTRGRAPTATTEVSRPLLRNCSPVAPRRIYREIDETMIDHPERLKHSTRIIEEPQVRLKRDIQDLRLRTSWHHCHDRYCAVRWEGEATRVRQVADTLPPHFRQRVMSSAKTRASRWPTRLARKRAWCSRSPCWRILVGHAPPRRARPAPDRVRPALTDTHPAGPRPAVGGPHPVPQRPCLRLPGPRNFKPKSGRFSLRTTSSRETPRISSMEGVGVKNGFPG